MATLELKFGDLFDSDAHAIGHGTNTHGKMGAGIAVLFRKRYPEMYERYRALCEEQDELSYLAGSCYLYELPEPSPAGYRAIANIFSQIAPGANAHVNFLVGGVSDAFSALWAEQEIENPHLAIPLIGCGIGGLDWDRDVHPALQDLVAELPEGWRLTVISNEPREGFLS